MIVYWRGFLCLSRILINFRHPHHLFPPMPSRSSNWNNVNKSFSDSAQLTPFVRRCTNKFFFYINWGQGERRKIEKQDKWCIVVQLWLRTNLYTSPPTNQPVHSSLSIMIVLFSAQKPKAVWKEVTNEITRAAWLFTNCLSFIKIKLL